MDIISAYRDGLIEQLDAEVADLAGRPCDHGQRAVVLHHLFDHSRCSLGWALDEAASALRLARGLAALKAGLARWRWLARNPVEDEQALGLFAEALGHVAAARCAAVYRAYRMTAAEPLRSLAEEQLPPGLAQALTACHAQRRGGPLLTDEARQSLDRLMADHADAAVDRDAIEAAWSALRTTRVNRLALRLLGERTEARARARARKRGHSATEKALRNDPILPAGFRANPAQHFYALLNLLAERRRQRLREACDREPNAFELAA